jgi:DNA mismatch repair protein MutL
MSIEVLSERVVAQIAAGEVVERPASVVKELIENSLDAGASNIYVHVVGGGRRMIRVSDDGCGISSNEAELGFARHATSKLRSVDDLLTIQTLGFRGEALASIAAVSHVTMATRFQNEEVGTSLRLEGGQILQRKAMGTPTGTVITVENLFYNTPARLKFLKKENTEKRHIATLITRYAMAYPQVRFVLEQDGREVFRSSGSGHLTDVMVAVLGLDDFKNMVEVYGEDKTHSEPITVSGFTSTPGLNRADRTHITLFVNGRWVQDTTLAYAVTQAYHTFLMNGRYPVAVLMISMPTQDVDVNVHPTKAEVRFRDSNAVFTAVQRAVRRAVVELARTPSVRGGRYAGLATARELDGWGGFDTDYSKQIEMNLSLESAGQYPRQQEHLATADDPTAIPEGLGTPTKPRTLPILRVVGQIGGTYIVAEGPVGMYLIDQHAAHERILYEQFMDEYERKQTVVQHTLAAQTINLSPSEARLIEENMDALQKVGFELEAFGPNTFVIRSVPAMLADNDPLEAVGGILDDLELGHTPGQPSIEKKIVLRVCKQAAVKAGQILSLKEMQVLIQQLERCESPHTCPHGRPTMLHMSRDQLAREFGRA